jgi:hypothetical protein
MQTKTWILGCLALLNLSFSLSLALGAANMTKPNMNDPAPFPFTVCPGAPTDFQVNTLYVMPDPPAKGDNVTMQLLGTVDEQLTSGSNFVVTVLFSGVEIYSKTVDLGQATSLPTGPGPLALIYSIVIPEAAPPGAYTIDLTFNDQTNTELTCIATNFIL